MVSYMQIMTLKCTLINFVFPFKLRTCPAGIVGSAINV
jgi:hypothetical protein